MKIHLLLIILQIVNLRTIVEIQESPIDMKHRIDNIEKYYQT